MVGLEQNLEADLGIDSIKRIEIVGSLLQQLPERQREALAAHRSRLNTQPSLRGMLDLIEQATADAAAPAAVVGSDRASACRTCCQSRARARACAAARGDAPAPRTAAGRRRAQPDPGLLRPHRRSPRRRRSVAATLRGRDVEVAIVDPATLADEDRLLQWCAAFAPATPIAGLVHLAPLGSPAVAADGSPAQWRQAIQDNEKSLFLLLRELGPRMADEAHVVAASDLGGLFGREGSADDDLRLLGGSVGMVKSLRKGTHRIARQGGGPGSVAQGGGTGRTCSPKSNSTAAAPKSAIPTASASCSTPSPRTSPPMRRAKRR